MTTMSALYNPDVCLSPQRQQEAGLWGEQPAGQAPCSSPRQRHFCPLAWPRGQAGLILAEAPGLSQLWALMMNSAHCCYSVTVSLWTPRTAARQASLSFTISRTLLKFMSIESVMPSNHLTLGRLFSSCPQSFSGSGSFPMSQFFESVGQSTGASALASVLPTNIPGWFPLELTGLISLLSKGLPRVFSSIIVRKHQFFGAQPSASSENSSSPQGLA